MEACPLYVGTKAGESEAAADGQKIFCKFVNCRKF
jgi:hypothetical protein